MPAERAVRFADDEARGTGTFPTGLFTSPGNHRRLARCAKG